MKKLLLMIILFLIALSGINNLNAYWETCYWKYGFWATSDFNGNCYCKDWYHFEKQSITWNLKCVEDPSCSDTYWMWSRENYNWKCECYTWYYFWKDMFWKTQCIKKPTCSDTFGYWAKENYSWKCECKYWYTWWDKNWKDYCVDWDNLCTDKYWYNTSFNDNTKSCECKDWYTLKDWECEEKHNSAYFFLVEYSDDTKETIVKSFTTQQTYLLKLRYTTWLYKAKKFVNKKIVINMGTDWDIDKYDKFILNDDTIYFYEVVTDIISVKKVDDNYTLKTCQDIYGDNVKETLDNKCRCEIGYKWNYNNTACEEDELNSYKKAISCPDIINWYRWTDWICYCNIGYNWSNTEKSCIKIITSFITSYTTNVDNTDFTDENSIIEPDVSQIIKNKIDPVFIKLKKKYSSLSIEKQLKIYNTLDIKINSIVSKTSKNKDILLYLQYLIKKEIEKLENNNLLDDLLSD